MIISHWRDVHQDLAQRPLAGGRRGFPTVARHASVHATKRLQRLAHHLDRIPITDVLRVRRRHPGIMPRSVRECRTERRGPGGGSLAGNDSSEASATRSPSRMSGSASSRRTRSSVSIARFLPRQHQHGRARGRNHERHPFPIHASSPGADEAKTAAGAGVGSGAVKPWSGPHLTTERPTYGYAAALKDGAGDVFTCVPRRRRPTRRSE
jgi:hypothetical protein